ncbi:hypothetical protein ACFZC6_41265 [Streptomyces ossamyceticus]|uniref:Uncharacterized protein n=1 Tax=Streptomyces ossamyceticus TaxID=249581 RepID=A0ABV2UUC0_9ACTN
MSTYRHTTNAQRRPSRLRLAGAAGATCADETQPPPSAPKVAPPGTTLNELRNGVDERVERIGDVS